VWQCCNDVPNVLTVQGKGSVRYNTTLARVSLGAEHEGRNESAGQVMAVVARNAAAAVDTLKAMTVRELQTTALSLSPTYMYPVSGPPQVTGYHASMTVSYLVDTKMAGPSIDRAVSAGASTVQSVGFEAEPPVVQSARLQALVDAVNDANSQADAVLGVLDYARGVPKSVSIDYVSPPPSSPMNMALNFAAVPHALMAVRASNIPIEGGPQEVTATVEIRYSIDVAKPSEFA